MSTFTYVGNQPSWARCAFCGTNLSVKYIVKLDAKYPSDSVVQPLKVFACNACVAKRIVERKFD